MFLQHHAPAALLPLPIVYQVGWAPGPFWTVVENLALTEIRSPDPPARSDYAIPAHLCESVDKQNYLFLRPLAVCLTVIISRLFAYYVDLDMCSFQTLSAPKYVLVLQL